jgi:hypothetical protein
MSLERIAAQPGVKLVTVNIRTKLDAHYEFPDVDMSQLRSVIPESGRIPEGQPTLALVNASIAVLSIPLNIVQTITVGSDTLWKLRASDA